MLIVRDGHMIYSGSFLYLPRGECIGSSGVTILREVKPMEKNTLEALVIMNALVTFAIVVSLLLST